MGRKPLVAAELAPRFPVTSVPYALGAARAELAADLDCLACVSGPEVAFGYAGSPTPGGPAADLECSSACVGTTELVNAAVTTAKLAPCPPGQFFRSGSGGVACSTAIVVADSGNVGIGVPAPTSKLHLGGAMQFAADGSVLSKAPRVIHTADPVEGCPPARAANTDLFTQTFSLDRAGMIFSSASIIRLAVGRHDLYLVLDGSIVDHTLTYSPPGTLPPEQWIDAHVHWAGPVSAGNHTLSLRGNTANVWGCTGTWGAIDTIIFE